MAKIVAFSVPSITDGETAMHELDGVEGVADVALVYKNDKGKVKIHQTSDMTVSKGALGGALLGALASIFVGPVVGMAAGGTALGAVYGKLRDKGVNDKLMKLAGEQLDSGHAAVFLLADDAVADKVEGKVRALSNLKQYNGVIEVGDFPADAQKEVREALKQYAAA